MLLPAEIESKTLIPALRAILAKDLSENHNVREEMISKMLGVTQAAISNYIRGTRGDPELIKKLSAEKQVAEMIEEISQNLSIPEKLFINQEIYVIEESNQDNWIKAVIIDFKVVQYVPKNFLHVKSS